MSDETQRRGGAAIVGDNEQPRRMSRRQMLKFTGACAISVFLAGCTESEREAFFQKRFRELSPKEVEELLARLERDNSKQFGKTVSIGADPPLPGVLFGYGLDLSRCIGCRRCVHACVAENNQSRDPAIQWITVLSMKKDDGVDPGFSDCYAIDFQSGGRRDHTADTGTDVARCRHCAHGRRSASSH
jgi:molybdopterin-containing oxidoreductase family iron-sulfur binding subunit